MPPVQVSVESTAPHENQSFISFSVSGQVSGVSGSGHTLSFAPGFYEVTVHLPPGFLGAGISWLTQPPPAGGITPQQGETSVTFGLDNSGTNASFGFNLTFQTQAGLDHGTRIGPQIVSDPPPSVVFQSS